MEKANDSKILRVNGAIATDNSITLITKVNGKWYATRAKENNGAIAYENCKAKIEDNDDLIIDEMKSRTISAISIFVIVVLAYQIAVVFKNLMFATIVTALCIDSVVWKGSILKYFNNFWKIIHKKERRRMHAATHKVLNAYEFLKSVPNTDEAKKYSSFTENCDDAKNSLGIVTLLFMFIAGWIDGRFITPEKTLMIYGIALIVYAVIFRLGLYKFASWYSLKKPTRHQISMAIVALEEHLELIKKVKEDEDCILGDEKIKDIFISYEEATTI